MNKTRKIYSRSEAGFTLGELMIGLVIIAIIAGILAWNSTYLVRTYRNRQAVREVSGMIDFARARALRTRRFHRILLTPWSGNPFADDRGRLIIQQGDSASIVDAFGPTNGIPGQFDATKPNNQNLWIVGNLNVRRFGDVAVTRLHRNGQVAKSQTLPCLWIYFSPNGSICEPFPPPPSCSITDTSNYFTHTACYAAEHLVCMRNNLPSVGAIPHDATFIRTMGSGQSRIAKADAEACSANSLNNPCCGTDP